MAEVKDGHCQLCGEPLCEEEKMFRYHGFSGGCPKPPLVRETTVKAMICYSHRTDRDGQFWLDIYVDTKPHDSIGPFNTPTERQRAHDDLLNMMRSLGAKDLPSAAAH